MTRRISLQFTEEVMKRYPSPADYLTSVASTFVANVKSIAQQSLHTARQDYINGVTQHPIVHEGDKISITVELVGALPNMIEKGAPTFDMKKGMLKNKQYNRIFIRKGTPSSTRFQRMSQEQHQVMKHLKTTSDRTQMPAFLTRANSDVRAYGVHHEKSKKKNVNFKGYRHDSHIYQRMQKIVRKAGPTYGTFRSVSNKSDEDSWHHPGFEGLNIFDYVARMMEL